MEYIDLRKVGRSGLKEIRNEYLNHALKIFVHSGQLPYTVEEISLKIQSFMRKLQHQPQFVSNFFRSPMLSYL